MIGGLEQKRTRSGLASFPLAGTLQCRKAFFPVSCLYCVQQCSAYVGHHANHFGFSSSSVDVANASASRSLTSRAVRGGDTGSEQICDLLDHLERIRDSTGRANLSGVNARRDLEGRRVVGARARPDSNGRGVYRMHDALGEGVSLGVESISRSPRNLL